MGFDGTPPQNDSHNSNGEIMFTGFNLNNPPGRLTNQNTSSMLVDDVTQKQILQLKKEMGELSKDKAVLAQQVEMLKF